MSRGPRRGWALAAALSLFACAGTAPDYAREQRWAEQNLPRLARAEAVRIELPQAAGGQRFVGLVTRASGQPRGTVLLVHGMGRHPDDGVVGALRAGLAELGYTTLSIQMPVLGPAATAENYVRLFPQAAARLGAALQYLNQRGHARVAVVSHGFGARMVNYWLSRQPTQPVTAWIPLAVSNGELQALKGLPFPVFDVYAEKDLEVVLSNSRERAAVLRHLPGSKQVMVYGTDHSFAGKEQALAVLIDQLLRAVQ
jgi:alpha/beta superfamily hydrolase